MTITLPHIKSPARWWQSLGFGIQSPADYAFLHDVLRERLPYYCYEELKGRFPEASDNELETARLLFRIANNIQPEQVQYLGNIPPLYIAHVDAAPKRKGGRMLIADGGIVIPHFHSYNAIIITDINGSGAGQWLRLTQAKCVTYDMHSIGVALFLKNRYPEHYKV